MAHHRRTNCRKGDETRSEEPKRARSNGSITRLMSNRPSSAIQTVLDYHHRTIHRPSRYAPSPGFLDWDSQPDPFRRFVGADVVELSLVDGPDDVRLFESRTNAQPFTLVGLGLLLELALGLSAWKTAGADRWSLRNNPSSGNLHPTECTLVIWGACEGLSPGVYHYAPHDHVLERRASIEAQVAETLREQAPGIWGCVGLSSIIWREEWKYGARAYRYCQHDVGHALGAVCFAAAVLGWSVRADLSIGDATIETVLGLNQLHNEAAEPEHPDVVAWLGTNLDDRPPRWELLEQILRDTEWQGRANRLSSERVRWPEVAAVLPAVVRSTDDAPRSEEMEGVPIDGLNEVVGQERDMNACRLIRGRRSAQRMDRVTSMAWGDFVDTLMRTRPHRTAIPWDCFPYAPSLNLLCFVHAVESLEPGLYLWARAPAYAEGLRSSCPQSQVWSRIGDLPLYRLGEPMDVRKLASQVSCFQGIAGHGAVSLGMIGPLHDVLHRKGPSAYRWLHWEAGMIGQTLYLCAESMGLRGTGIGCFFDEDVMKLVGMPSGWASIYHFTIGGALDDARLGTEPAYGHLSARRKHGWGAG